MGICKGGFGRGRVGQRLFRNMVAFAFLVLMATTALGYIAQHALAGVLIAHAVGPIWAQITVVGTVDMVLGSLFVLMIRASDGRGVEPLAGVATLLVIGIGLNAGMVLAILHWAIQSVSIVVK